MKKFALAAIATALIGFAHAPVSAQTDDVPVECAESDGRDDVACQEFYVEARPPTTPATESTTTTTTTTTTVVAGSQGSGGLPRTGSGVSSILGMGAALLVGGGIVVVATRRRSTASTH